MTAGCSMLAMIRSLPPQRWQVSISMPNTRHSRRAQSIATPACNEKPPARGRAVRIALQPLPTGWHRLQREQLLPGPRAHGDPVRDRVPDQVIERIGLPVAGKPRVLHVPLDQTTPFQQTTDTFGDLLDQRLQLLGTGLAHRAEHRRTPTPSVRYALSSSSSR